jgi:serine/threonine protein phosphatase PrpC
MTEKGTNELAAVPVVSAMEDAGQEKNQDRAIWHRARQTACVCDGVTSSPFSGEAAEHVTTLSPTLFSGNVQQRLESICDLLHSRREEKLATAMKIPDGTSDAMTKLLQEAAHEKIKSSFQTTMVAAQFEPRADSIKASVVRCGDSMFVAFGPKSEPLWCSPPSFDSVESTPSQGENRWQPAAEFTFGPGDEVLVTIESSLAHDLPLAQQTQIAPRHRGGFYVCRVLMICRPAQSQTAIDPVAAWTLRPGDRIVVPKYLIGHVTKTAGCCCTVVRYSRMIRNTQGQTAPPRLRRGGAVTAVLPDHFRSGRWSYFTDVFPRDTEFVVCSDGFSDCFEGISAMASWFKKHRQAILNPEQRGSLLNKLHEQLRQRGHDDDISFVWIFPPGNSGGASKKNENPSRGA